MQDWDVICSKQKSLIPVRIHQGSGCYNVVGVDTDEVIKTDFTTCEKATNWAIARFMFVEIPGWIK